MVRVGLGGVVGKELDTSEKGQKLSNKPTGCLDVAH